MSWNIAVDDFGVPYMQIPSSVIRIMLAVSDTPTVVSTLNAGFTGTALTTHVDALVRAGFLLQHGKKKRRKLTLTPAGRELAEQLTRLNDAYRAIKYPELIFPAQDAPVGGQA